MKFVIKGSDAIVAAGLSPAWTTGSERLSILPLIQSATIDCDIDSSRQKAKQLGSQDLAVNHCIYAPNVQFSIDYLMHGYGIAEQIVGHSGSHQDSFLYKLDDFNQNFYFIVNEINGQEGLYKTKQLPPSTNFSGHSIIGLGNCYLSNYSINFALGQIPSASMTFDAANLRFDLINSNYNYVQIPAINEPSGNSTLAGSGNLSSLYSYTGTFVSGDIQGRTELNPRVYTHYSSAFTLEEIQYGGIKVGSGSNPILQSLNIDIPINRSALYGLGSNFPMGRKVELPVIETVTMEFLVSGFTQANITGLLSNEQDYSITLQCKDFLKDNNSACTYQITNAKLSKINYSLPWGDNWKLGLSYTFELTTTGGLLFTAPTGMLPADTILYNGTPFFFNYANVLYGD